MATETPGWSGAEIGIFVAILLVGIYLVALGFEPELAIDFTETWRMSRTQMISAVRVNGIAVIPVGLGLFMLAYAFRFAWKRAR